MKTDKFENDAFSKRSVFSVNAKNGDIWKRFAFLCIGCWLQWPTNSRLAPFWQLLTKGFVFKRGLTTSFCWSSVNVYRIHSVFIWKRSNVNGQRFHQQKRIEMKTEQCVSFFSSSLVPWRQFWLRGLDSREEVELSLLLHNSTPFLNKKNAFVSSATSTTGNQAGAGTSWDFYMVLLPLLFVKARAINPWLQAGPKQSMSEQKEENKAKGESDVRPLLKSSGVATGRDGGHFCEKMVLEILSKTRRK